MAEVELQGVSKRFEAVEAVRGIDLTVGDGELCVFVGPSGSGKSTLLRLIAGLETPTAGAILFDGARVDLLPPARRRIAMVFQSYALYPHMSVRENMAFGLRRAKLGRRQIEERIATAARILAIEPLLDRKPRELSGGQQQRVAIGRAIVRQPRVFLFDEPLSNLDAALRVQMRIELARLHRDLGATMIYVTHDQVEAMTLADRIVVLAGGAIEQVGPPLEVYHRPRNRFVAGFIGSPRMNFLEVEVVAAATGGITVTLAAEGSGGGRLVIPVRGDGVRVGERLTLGARPEALILSGGECPFQARTIAVERLGSVTFAYLDAAVGESVVAAVPGDTPLQVGETAFLGLDAGGCHLFDAAGRALEPLAARR